ncbi:hypothetical protein CKA55_11780 [Arcobacter suis]|uniref:Uncharacterized protein n=1 Tax=Arcobacter suis CECT 7833 TaxID=663365 RepID=A0AAD0SSX0_9BACT|nr:hypothetical protein [Arcobacter suis]AXX90470.1 hypothetical protein ASUIS_2009 [Arcobacter suis CECT 7833]RWS45603.1 hypothetical protein CKA55_11780 [Arcobacter suis]
MNNDILTSNETIVKNKNSKILQLQLKYKIDETDPLLGFFYLIEDEIQDIVEQNKKASILIKDLEFHIPKMKQLILSVESYETNVRDRILDDLNSNLKELELKHVRNLTSISSKASEMQNNFERILEKEEELKEDLKNSREAVVSELEKFAFEIKLQRNSFENSKSNFYKNMEENLKILFEKSFSNLKILVIFNITLSLIIFTYLLLK